MAIYLYAGTARVSGNSFQTLHKLNLSDGSTVWSRDRGESVFALVGNTTDVYVGGGRASSITHKRYSVDGSVIWSADRGAFLYDIALDPDNGYVFTVGSTFSGFQVERWNISNGGGGAIESAYFDGRATSVCIYRPSSTSYFYTAGAYSSATSPYNFGIGTSFYTTLSDLHSTANIERMRMDSSGNIYIVGASTAGITTRKYNNALTQQWTADHGATVLCVCVDGAGNVYTGGAVGTGTYTTRKYDSSGNLVWSANHGNSVYGIAVDTDGNVYTNGLISGGVTTRKYNSSGSQQWAINLGADGYGIIVNEETVPPLALAGGASISASASGLLHVQIPASTPRSLLSAVMLVDNPALLAPVAENLTPAAEQPYTYAYKELADISGSNRVVLLNGSVGFSTTGGNISSRSPVPRIAAWGVPLVTWNGYSSPSILTDLGPSTFVVGNAWSIEFWYRRYYYQPSYYHFYFGNGVAYDPPLHHIYLAQGWFEIAGDRHKRVQYSLSDSDGAYHHVVLTYNGSSTVMLYLDGVAAASLSQSLSALNIQIDARARLWWGDNGTDSYSIYPPSPAQCTYSYLAFYPSELSLARIQVHYQTGISAAAQKLQAQMDIRLSPNYFIGNI